MKVANDFRIFRSELEDVNDNEIDFLALPESTFTSNNHYVQSRLKMLVEYHCPSAKLCITNRGGYDRDACYQPGGVMTLAMGKLSGRYADSGNYSLGRYSWTEFCGKKKALKICTFYQVAQTSGGNMGDSMAYVQQFVRRVGVAPFSKLFTSDHRGMYMDIQLRHILDTPDIEFRQAHSTKLQVSIPRRTTEYIKRVSEKWEHHKLEDKIDKLMETYEDISDGELEHTLNILDVVQVSEILTYSKKRCTSVNKNTIHEWSPKLGALSKEERQCRKRIRNLKRNPLDWNFRNINEEIKKEETELKKLVKDMREVKKNDAEYRKAHMHFIFIGMVR